MRNEIVCGDNCDVLVGLEKSSVDLVLTSPPYDDLRDYKGFSWDFYGVAWLLKRALADGGVIVWVVADQTTNGSETGSSMRQALHFKEIGLNLHDTMIYRTNKPPFANGRYQHCWEYAFVFSKGKPKTFNPLMEKCLWAGAPQSPTKRQKDGELTKEKKNLVVQEEKIRENIWHYASGSGKQENFDHPAMFPVQLARDHVLSWSNPGDLVVDPFNGSGTTTTVAREMGRDFLGIDISEDYCQIARDRLKQQLLFS